MDILRDKEGRSNIRLIVLVFVVLSGIAAALILYPPIPTKTEPEKTSGDITFTDSAGKPLIGGIELSGAGVSSGLKPNVNFISWTNVPNARVYYNAMDTKGVSVNLRISGDSPKGRAILENYAVTIPGSVNVTAPGTLVKYVEISATGVSFVEADIAIKYTDAELNGQDENNLAIYHYDQAAQAWSELSTKIDATNNIVSATVNSLSIFAVSTRIPQDIEVHDIGKMPVISDIKTYDEARTLKKEAKTSKLSSMDVPDSGELEVDALASKNVAVKLKVNMASGGEIILDDFGKNNPVSVPLPGKAVKFVEIGASGILFSSANITIRYSDSELNGGNEHSLTIYHWNGVSWDAVPTVIDTLNKTLSATTTSLSQWGVATSVTIVANATGNTGQSGRLTGENLYSTTVTNAQWTTRTALTAANLDAMSIDDTTYFAQTGTNALDVITNVNFTLSEVQSVNYVIISYTGTSTTTAEHNIIGLYNATTPAGGGWTKLNSQNPAVGTYATVTYNVSSAADKANYLVLSNNVLTFRFAVWNNGTANAGLSSDLMQATINYNQAVAELSGYVKDTSSVPLSGATVQINTSLPATTTNATGAYNFTGLSNGTYMINASLTGYITSSINVTISGADNTTANISLSPLPTYLLSGYVTNASSGAAISGANVTMNTSQTTTTNATGYYNFTLANGTYIITGSNTSYYDNSITQIINGVAVSNANITLTPLPSLADILVATNRYSITSFNNASIALSGYDSDNSSFTFTGGALVIDTNGRPVSGENVYYEIKSAAGTLKANGTKVTASNGLVLFSYNTTRDFTADTDPDYGTWTVMARLVSNTSINKTVGVNISIAGYTSNCNNGYCHHNPADINNAGSTQTSPRSPYSDKFGISGTGLSMAAGGHIGRDHGKPCVTCHPGYGIEDGAAADSGKPVDTDMHRNLTCTSCHGTSDIWPIAIPSCYNANCHPLYNRNLTNITTLATINGITNVSIYSTTNGSTVIAYSVHNGSQYSNTTGVPCWICHGPMHNITKPDPSPANKNNITEYTQCTACHGGYKRHNNSVSCTICHSQDAHIIKVFAQNATYINGSTSSYRGNCTNCHQNSSFLNSLLLKPMAGNYTGRNPPQIPAPLNHSTDPYAGALWNGTQSGYWDNTSQKSACYYCHGNTTHSTLALGSISNVKGTNNLNQSLDISRWCANCHYKTAPDYGGDHFTPQPPEILNQSGLVPVTARDGTGFVNHSNYFSSGYNDSVCKSCHNNNLSASATSLNFSHNVNTGSGGAPNCIQCHNLATGLSGGAPVGINFTAANLSVHFGINSQNATNQGYVPVVGACWACHDTDGNVTSGHPDMYKTPKTCVDCHLSTGTYYSQSVSWGGLTVSEHYYGGDQVKTGSTSSNISSCINCHENVSEMILYNNDTDTGQSFTGDGVRLVGGNMSFYHYGANRTKDLRTGNSANCSYCHKNTSTNFTIAMSDPAYSSNVSNHSMSYSSTNPDCSQCHNSGWIHNSTLTKPNLTLPNSTYCLSCHGTPGNSSTTIKNLSQHNGTVDCTRCHLNTNSSIHPVRYLQQDGSNFSTGKTSAVNCTTCHQVGLINFSTAPRIPTPMNHSTNNYSGALWNWTTGYWTNTSQQTACNYCHNKSALHNASGLGNISKVKGSNSKNQGLDTGTWCANCHYGDAPGYSGTQYDPRPPEVLNRSGLMPETAWDGATKFINHSDFLSGGYNDSRCKACHNNNLSADATSLNFSHNLAPGGGGPNCTQCHDISGSGAPTDKRINASAMRQGIHQNLNRNATNTTALDPINKACWACHGTGEQPVGHPTNYNTPYSCLDCHNRTSNLTFTTNNSIQTDLNKKQVAEHILIGYSENITSTRNNPAVNCTYCHNKSISDFNISFTAKNYIAANISHYATNTSLVMPTTNCNYCHKTPANASTYYANVTRHPAKTQDVSYCKNCHNTTNATSFHSQSLDFRFGYTASIHGGPGSIDYWGFDWEQDDWNEASTPRGEEGCNACHKSGYPPRLCENCHLPDTSSLFTGPRKDTGLNLNASINDSIPRLYSHTNYSSVNVPNQSKGDTASSCYGVGGMSCHGVDYINMSNAGGYFAFNYLWNDIPYNSDVAHFTNTIDHMPNTTGCLFCHNQSTPSIRSAWGNATQVNASTMFGNRYDATKNESCYACHTSDNSTPKDFHASTIVSGGGPGCLDCHNTSNPQNYSDKNGNPLHYIDGSIFNNSVHARINEANSTVNGTDYGINASCWACHNSSGYAVANNTHPDRRDTPYICTDCHLASGSNTQAYNATIITEHFINGTEIRTGNATSNISSCIKCHENSSEMILSNSDTDTGTFTGDGIRLSGGNQSYYHYGKPRTDLRTWDSGTSTNCTYCHQNITTSFKLAMTDQVNNSNISNHSTIYSSSPVCTECHSTGWIHNSTLTKPSLSLPNSSYCLTCHGPGGSASINNIERHNNTLNCTQCHLDINRSIHPVRYLQNDLIWNTTRTNAVNCTTCHQTGLTGFENATRVPTPMNHSTNNYSGALWNWTTGYWTNTSQQSACNYCHNKSALHNASGLGNITKVKGSNSKNQSLDTGTWCANCHYGDASGYSGTQYDPRPPEVLNKSGLMPETARDGATKFINHSDFLSGGYNDSRCKACHNNNLSADATSLNFSHNLAPGGGGPNCTQCHDISGSGAPTDKRINASAMRLGVHKNLNQNATNTTSIDLLNKACWACHGDGLEPAGHPENYSNPWACPDCHSTTVKFNSTNATVRSDVTRITVGEHIQSPYDESISSTVWDINVTCYNCHNKSQTYSGVSFIATNSIAANLSHYANTSDLITPTSNCGLCHKSQTNSTEWYANLTRHPAKSQNNTFCANCHNSTNATTLHDRPLIQIISVHGGGGSHTGIPAVRGFDWENDDFNQTGLSPADESCVACHGGNSCTACHPLGAIVTPKLCENCHLPDTDSLFTGPNQSSLYNLRSDINATLPRVYAHTSYSSVAVPALRGNNATDIYAYPTTCFNYYTSSGENVYTCHGTPYSSRSSFGGYYALNVSSGMDVGDPAHRTQTIDRAPNTTNCLFCHNQSDPGVRSAWGNAMLVNASNMFGNQYDVTGNTSCYTCHTTDNSTPKDFHANTLAGGGGPGCLVCHNSSDPQNYSDMNGNPLHYIDVGIFNNSVHARINEANSTVNGIDYGINASCWACHNSSGTAVSNNTHPDKRDTPYICTDCHLANGSNAGAFNATIIYNHYKNGTNIRAQDNQTSDIASCIGCHENVSGMITPNNDTDYGSFASDGVGLNGGNTSFYHYGVNRSSFGKTPGSYEYCIYCHRNTTGEFNITFQDIANSSISNHSTNYNNSNPSCSDGKCHNSTNSTLHGSPLTKPDLALPNSSYCLGCHGNNGAGGTNYTGAVTGYKERHNNTVDCTKCHLNTSKSIHPVRYLQEGGLSWSTTNSSAVNCTTCHQGSVLTDFSNAPKVSNTVQHSDNSSNGSIWNNTRPYWTNTSQQSMCNYCHGDSRHNTTPLGIPANWSGGNTVNSSITGNSNWCAGCHYQGYSNSGKDYSNMTRTFTGASKPVPPEITNHTSYAPYNVSGYYNHSLAPDYNDTTCKNCHGKSLPTGADVKDFVHNVSTGVCTNCHYSYDYMNSVNEPERFVNQSMFEASPHGNLSCENCHTKGHNNIGARKACEDCHAVQQNPITDRDRHNITRDPWSYKIDGIPVVNITTCITCHNETLYSEAIKNYGLPPQSRNCDYCHTYPDKTYS